MDDHQPWEEHLRKWMSWAIAVGLALFTIGIGVQVLVIAPRGFWDDVIKNHIPSVLGLPCAAIASLVIVLVLRTVSGAIEFKVLGIELKDATGPIIMWVVCFLAMALAIVKTWDLKTNSNPNPATHAAWLSPK